jgi:hypothetical protein
MLLVALEILPPPTRLNLQLRTRQWARPVEGDVVWSDAERQANKPPVAHGMRFARPVDTGLAVELFMIQSTLP